MKTINGILFEYQMELRIFQMLKCVVQTAYDWDIFDFSGVY